MDTSSLKQHAQTIRRDIIRMVTAAQSSHVGSALSLVDILTVLYFDILQIDPQQPEQTTRDRCILSKGHATTALYATLALRGFFDRALLDTYCQPGSCLAGHPMRQNNLGIEFSAGSLGHGLSFGAGQALSAKCNQETYRVFVLLGDGECNEGSVWEAALFAQAHNLDNLVAIVDFNKLQGYGRSTEVLKIEPLLQKWQAFGWSGCEINGHDLHAIQQRLKNIPCTTGKPSIIIAHTTKGKGVSFMEDRLEWHYKSPNKEQAEQALKELDTSN